METLERAARLAARGQIGAGVQLVLDLRLEDADVLAATLLQVADLEDALLADFASHDRNYLIEGRWGRFWLCPEFPRRVLLPRAPVIVPKYLKVIAAAVAKLSAGV